MTVMKCPICHKDVPKFREHALQHVRADQAYAVEVFDPSKGVARLTLYPITEPLDKVRLKQLRKQFENATTTIIHGTKLRMLEVRQKFVK